ADRRTGHFVLSAQIYNYIFKLAILFKITNNVSIVNLPDIHINFYVIQAGAKIQLFLNVAIPCCIFFEKFFINMLLRTTLYLLKVFLYRHKFHFLLFHLLGCIVSWLL